MTPPSGALAGQMAERQLFPSPVGDASRLPERFPGAGGSLRAPRSRSTASMVLPVSQLTLLFCKPKIRVSGLWCCLGPSQLCCQEGLVAARWSDGSRVGQDSPLLAIVISTLAPHRSFFGLTITIAALCCVRGTRRHWPLLVPADPHVCARSHPVTH